MSGTVSVKSADGFSVAVARRKARKEYRCQSDIDALLPESREACSMSDSHIHPGQVYMEVAEGDDIYHPLRYHVRCAVKAWGLTGELDVAV